MKIVGTNLNQKVLSNIYTPCSRLIEKFNCPIYNDVSGYTVTDQLIRSIGRFPGTIHGDAGPVHEERPRLRPGLLDNGPVDVQRPARPAGADTAGKGHGRRADGPRRQQMRPRGREGRRQGPGQQSCPAVQLRVHGDIGQSKN